MDLNIHYFEACNSTSTTAQGFLSEGRKAPFAVVAREQYKGKGRRGKHWESPVGNIYFTLALPAHACAGPQRGLLPIKAAVIVCQWLQTKFHINPVLKWPNDICFGLHKFAGILCESSFCAGAWGDFLVGLGLNVLPAFQNTHGRLSYDTTSISEILGRSFSQEEIKTLSFELIDFFHIQWFKLGLENIGEEFNRFSMEPSQVWYLDHVKTLNFYSCGQLLPDGSLTLNSWNQKDKVEKLNSVSHSFRSLYQYKSALPLILADVGNSAIKFAIYTSIWEQKALKTFTYSATINRRELDGILSTLFKLVQALLKREKECCTKKWPLFVGSVNESSFSQLRDCSESHGLKVIRIKKKPIFSWGYRYVFSQIGIDRLAFVESWLSEQSKMEKKDTVIGILVCAGTASTFDVVCGDGEHLGGFIIPGLRTSWNALSEKTDRLPKIQADVQELKIDKMGHDTREAIVHGSVHMTVALVERIKREFDKFFPEKSKTLLNPTFEVVIAGGCADFLKGFFSQVKLGHSPLNGFKIMAFGGLLANPKNQTACKEKGGVQSSS